VPHDVSGPENLPRPQAAAVSPKLIPEKPFNLGTGG